MNLSCKIMSLIKNVTTRYRNKKRHDAEEVEGLLAF